MVFGANNSSAKNSSAVSTNVELSKNNFKVIGTVKGSASNWWIFLIFGGMKKNIVGQAYQNMLTEAKLEGSSKAVINITYDWHKMFVLIFFGKNSVTAHGTVIEFIAQNYPFLKNEFMLFYKA